MLMMQRAASPQVCATIYNVPIQRLRAALAVRELLKRGLAAEGFLLAAPGAKSSQYGVTGKDPTGR